GGGETSRRQIQALHDRGRAIGRRRLEASGRPDRRAGVLVRGRGLLARSRDVVIPRSEATRNLGASVTRSLALLGMTKRATSRALSFLPESPYIFLDQALDLLLRQLPAEGGHVFSPLRDCLDQIHVA